MIDKEKIENLLSELDEFLTSLMEMKNLTDEEYISDKRNIYSGRYLLQISIETCINISNHIISRKQFGLPREYADAFRLLHKNNIIPKDLLEKLILMTRFRNRIVHIYWNIDDKYIFELINNNLNDLYEFRKYIKKYLSVENNSESSV